MHQYDPRQLVPGGIDTLIDGIIRYAPLGYTPVVIGADRCGDGATALGELIWLDVGGRDVGFLPVTRLGATGRVGRVPETLKLAVGLAQFRQAVREAVDELQVHRPDTGLVTSRLFPGLSRVQCVHGPPHALQHRPASYLTHLRWLMPAVDRGAVRRAAWTFVFSRAGAERLRAVSPNVSNVTSWYDPAVTRTRLAPRRDGLIRALWVGRLVPEKDPMLAVGALRAFVSGTPGPAASEATIAGNGVMLAQVQDAIADEPRIRCPGPMDRDEVAEAMADADVVLLTSAGTSEDAFEGSPTTMWEALAAGTPVVCTEGSDSDLRIVDGMNGYRVRERSAQGLASAMNSALGLSRAECARSVADLAAPSIVPRLFESAAR